MSTSFINRTSWLPASNLMTSVRRKQVSLVRYGTSGFLAQPVLRRGATLTAAWLAALVMLAASATGAAAETSVIGGPGQYLQPAIVNLSSSGYTGQRQLLDYQWCTRWAGNASGGVQSATFFAFRAPAYDAYVQDVTMHVRLDRWNGSAWTVERWHPSTQTITSRPGTSPRFGLSSFSVYPGYTYRLVHVITWSVNGVVVGQVYDQVNGDAIARNGTLGLVDNNTGNNAGWCRFYR